MPILDADARIITALAIARDYGGCDGGRHKMWVIDRMVRALLGSDEFYDQWVEEYQGEVDEDGNPEYLWDEGAPP